MVERRNRRMAQHGMTLLEIVIAVAIVGILGTFALSSYEQYRERVDNAQALAELRDISLKVSNFYSNHNRYPTDLAEVYGTIPSDPWGNPYMYLNIPNQNGLGKVRKDKNLVPINTDFDLYSAGKDGKTSSALTAQISRDDVIRANNGSFFGTAKEY